jgi:hypothetical protein
LLFHRPSNLPGDRRYLHVLNKPLRQRYVMRSVREYRTSVPASVSYRT